MNWIFISCGITTFLVIVYFFKDRKKYKYSLDGLVFAFLIANMIAAIIGLLLAGLTGLFFDKEIVSKHYTDIVSIDNGSNVSGSFMLGSGTINETNYYIMYAKTSDDKYYQTRCPVDNSFIEEKAGLSNEGMIVQFNFNLACNPNWCISTPDIIYNIYVPKNTIIRNFQL